MRARRKLVLVNDQKILVVDDDVHVRRMVEGTFTKAGAHVITAPDGKEGLRAFHEERPDLVILDIMMPRADGWETCRQIRNMSDVPIIMLTALDQNEDVIRGLDNGADDFVTKPFMPGILLARAKAALRRARLAASDPSPDVFDDGFLALDPANRRVAVRGEPVDLTPKEYDLLIYLFRNLGRVRTFKQILEYVWGAAYQDSPEYVHVYISHIRRKIEPKPKAPQYIATIHGVGYRFEQQK